MSINPISFRPTDDDLKTIALAEWAQNHPEENMNTTTTCYLENPWSGTVTEMTWGEIVKWAEENVHDSARAEWLREARRAAAAGDSKALGTMIIGS